MFYFRLVSPGISRTSIPRTTNRGSCLSVLSVPQSHRESSGHPKNSHPWWLTCPSVLSVPQSHRESSGHPKYSHPWWLSQCPICPTVPPGVLRTSQVLLPLVVVPVSRLSHSSTGSPQTLPPLAVVPVSCLSHSPIGSPQDIPRILLGHLRAQCVNNPASQVKHDRLKLEVTQHTFNTCLH